jgi:hypothetical protein
MVPTLNNTGWMIETPDRVSVAFAEYAGALDSEVLDIGCAYGVETLPAVEFEPGSFAPGPIPPNIQISST